MGTKMAVAFANIFMAKIEKGIISKSKIKPLVWKSVVTKTRNQPKPPKTTQNHPKPPTKPTKTTQNQLQHTNTTRSRDICVDGRR